MIKAKPSAIKHVRTIEEVFGRQLDCYVSTDTFEVGPDFTGILSKIGFLEHDYREDGLAQQYQEVSSCCSFYAVNPHTGLFVEGIDIPLEEALRMSASIGFTPMAKLRIYSNGDRKALNQIGAIIRELDEARQNMAFVDANGSRVYVKLSDFYEPARSQFSIDLEERMRANSRGQMG